MLIRIGGVGVGWPWAPLLRRALATPSGTRARRGDRGSACAVEYGGHELSEDGLVGRGRRNMRVFPIAVVVTGAPQVITQAHFDLLVPDGPFWRVGSQIAEHFSRPFKCLFPFSHDGRVDHLGPPAAGSGRRGWGGRCCERTDCTHRGWRRRNGSDWLDGQISGGNVRQKVVRPLSDEPP